MVAYINPPLETDPDQLSSDAFDFLQQNIPGWVPSDGHLESWMVYALARMVAGATDVAANVPLAVFRYFGQTIVGLAPIDAVVASADTTWTMVDNAGYTIPAGTNVGYQITGDTVIPFITIGDIVVPPGQLATAAGAVHIVAADPGVAGNNLGPAGLILVDPLAYVANVVALNPTAGGVDAEDDTTYISRLIDYLKIYAPRPVFASDFAALAREITGVWRATGLDNYLPARSFTDGSTTNANAIVTSPALAQFTADDVGRGITGPGIPVGTTVLSVDSAIQIHMSANATATAAGVTLTIAKKTNAERAVAVAAIDQYGQPVNAAIKANVLAFLQSLRETNFVVSMIDPTYTVVNADFHFVTFDGYVAADVISAAVTAVANFLSPATWGVDPSDKIGTSWSNNAVVRYNQVIGILNNVPGLRYVTSLTLNGAAADVNLAGDIPLPEAGVITGESP